MQTSEADTELSLTNSSYLVKPSRQYTSATRAQGILMQDSDSRCTRRLKGATLESLCEEDSLSMAKKEKGLWICAFCIWVQSKEQKRDIASCRVIGDQ